MASRHQARRLEWRRAFALALPVILLVLLVPALQGRATAESPDPILSTLTTVPTWLPARTARTAMAT